MTDLTQRITDLPPESVHHIDCPAIDLDHDTVRMGNCECGVPALLAECVSRITELEAEVATRAAHEERLFRAYLRVQGIPDDEIDAEITRKAATS